MKSKYDNDELMETVRRDDDGIMEERVRRDISDYLTPAFDEVINDIDKVLSILLNHCLVNQLP